MPYHAVATSGQARHEGKSKDAEAMAWLKALGFTLSLRLIAKDQREQGGTAQEEFEKRWCLDSNLHTPLPYVLLSTA